MTITIELSDELVERLDSAGIPADEAKRYAVAALSEAAENAEIRAWWGSLSAAKREAERETTKASLSAADAGRTTPAAEAASRIRAKYGARTE